MPKFRDNFIPFLALAVGLAVMPIALLGWDLSFIPGDLGDTRFNIYILEHGYLFLSGQHESYWNAPFMYPFENVISLSDNLLGTVPLYSAFRILGFDIFTAFQLWVITIFTLNFLCAYWLFKWMFKNAYAAAIAAFIFAFSMSLQSQMSHVQVFARFFIPLAFLFIFKFGKTFNPRYFFLAALSIVGQLYCGIYIGMLMLLPSLAVLLILVIMRYKLLVQSLKKFKWWVLILLSIGINAALLYKLMWPYYKQSLISLTNTFESIFTTLPKLMSYFYAKHDSLLWAKLENVGYNDIPAWWDHQLFPGVFPYISIIAAIIVLLKFKVKNRIELSLLLIVGITTFLTFLRIGDFTLYEYVFKIPGFSALRSLTRIIGINLLFFGLAAGIFVNYLIVKFPKRPVLIFAMILGFVVVDNYISPSGTFRSSKAIAVERVNVLKTKMDYLPAGTVVSYEPDEVDNGVAVQLDAMLATQALSLKCVNGYSGTSPHSFTPYWVNPNEENRINWLNSVGIDPNMPVVVK